MAFRGINPAPTLLFFSSIVKLPRFIEKIREKYLRDFLEMIY